MREQSHLSMFRHLGSGQEQTVIGVRFNMRAIIFADQERVYGR